MNDRIDQADDFHLHKFAGLDLAGLSLEGKSFEGCEFRHCRFSGAMLERCRFVDCSFHDCDLTGVVLSGSRLQAVTLIACTAIGIDWGRAHWSKYAITPQLRFHRSTLDDASFFGLELKELVIEDCRAHRVDFREGCFDRADFSRTDLRHSLFVRTGLRRADFTGATAYDIDPGLNAVEGARFSRDEAVRLLVGLGIELVD